MLYVVQMQEKRAFPHKLRVTASTSNSMVCSIPWLLIAIHTRGTRMVVKRIMPASAATITIQRLLLSSTKVILKIVMVANGESLQKNILRRCKVYISETQQCNARMHEVLWSCLLWLSNIYSRDSLASSCSRVYVEQVTGVSNAIHRCSHYCRISSVNGTF
jgi:hypothetical protein